jgi:cell division GTPase FtsZ
MLNTNTKMSFHHCWNDGWWNGTAAPVIAQLAKERDILTVGYCYDSFPI